MSSLSVSLQHTLELGDNAQHEDAGELLMKMFEIQDNIFVRNIASEFSFAFRRVAYCDEKRPTILKFIDNATNTPTDVLTLNVQRANTVQDAYNAAVDPESWEGQTDVRSASDLLNCQKTVHVAALLLAPPPANLLVSVAVAGQQGAAGFRGVHPSPTLTINPVAGASTEGADVEAASSFLACLCR